MRDVFPLHGGTRVTCTTPRGTARHTAKHFRGSEQHLRRGEGVSSRCGYSQRAASLPRPLPIPLFRFQSCCPWRSFLQSSEMSTASVMVGLPTRNRVFPCSSTPPASQPQHRRFSLACKLGACNPGRCSPTPRTHVLVPAKCQRPAAYRHSALTPCSTPYSYAPHAM